MFNILKFVQIEYAMSTIRNIEACFPLEPVLILPYIHDLYKAKFKGSIIVFSDATAVVYGASDIDRLFGFMRHDLKLLIFDDRLPWRNHTQVTRKIS